MTDVPFKRYDTRPFGLPVKWETGAHGWVAVPPVNYPAEGREITVGFLTEAWHEHPAGATVVIDHTHSPQSFRISLEVEPWAAAALARLESSHANPEPSSN